MNKKLVLRIILIVVAVTVLAVGGYSLMISNQRGSFPSEASIEGPLDTTLAEVTILSVSRETAYLRIDRVRDYERYPGATYPEVKSGDELEVKIKNVVPRSNSGAGERAQQGESPSPPPPPRPDVGGGYLANMRLCITEYIGGLSCEYEGWSADLYPL